MRHQLRLYLLLGSLLMAVAACQRQVLTPPEITVVITIVDDQEALDVAVGGALTATQEQNVHVTETVLARGGITLTPTSTPTLTPVPPTATETPYLSPTPTDPPSPTATSTLAPLPSNTPAAAQEVAQVNGRVRVVNAWQGVGTTPVDVYLDDLPVASALTVGQATQYQGVHANNVRITLRQPPEEVEAGELITPPPPLISAVIEVPSGGGVTVIVTDIGQGLVLIPTIENLEPIATNRSRLTVLQANPDLLRSDVLLPNQNLALAYNLELGQMPGPFDVPAGDYSMTFFDADIADSFIGRLDNLRLDNRLSYLMVLLPPSPENEDELFTDYFLVSSTTRRTATDTAVHFVNSATGAGALTILIDGVEQVKNLPVGQTTIPIPASTLGQRLTFLNSAGEQLMANVALGPWEDSGNDQIVVITDAAAESFDPLIVTTFGQSARPSAVRSNIRLIHALTGTTREVDLEIRSTTPELIENDFGVPPSQQGDTTWSPVIQGVEFATASEYEARNPNSFDVRVVINSTQNVLATVRNLRLLAGGVYDFVLVPGGSQGVAQLILIQPDVQTTSLGINQADPEVIQEQVEVALTASAPAPEESATPTLSASATPTVSPVPTNTPRPSNTPSAQQPNIIALPAPPDTVGSVFVLRAENFAPNRRYTINIDTMPEDLSGSIGDDGSLTLTITVPTDLGPGLHTVRICVDCRIGGLSQEEFALFRVAAPGVTPTATRER